MFNIFQVNFLILIFILVVVITSVSSDDAFVAIEKRLKFNQKELSAETQEIAAFNVIKRILISPEDHEKFKVFVDSSLKPNSFEVRYRKFK